MKKHKYISDAEVTLKLLDSLEKVKAKPFFETRQLALIDAQLKASYTVFNWQRILKPAFIVFLIGINVSIVFSYLHRVNTYSNTRNTALIQLSDNYMRSSDYYVSIQK